MKDILIIIFFISILGMGIKEMSVLQKNNNYNRCLSVVKKAIQTGRLPDITNPIKKCKYHLE